MPTASIRGTTLYFETTAPEAQAQRSVARRVLFLSGSGGDLRQKPSVFDGPLARKFELLAYDQRGLGQSAVPDGPYTMEDYAEDAAALLDHVGWDQCAVIGVSFGGMVAQELAVRHPQRIERLVLACTSSGGAGGSSYPLHELSALSPEERLAKSLELSDNRMDAAWREANPEAFERVAAFYRGRNDLGAGDARRALGARLQLEARAGLDVFERLSSLRMPVYCCGGRYDGIAPPANQQAMARQIPGAQLEFFEGGHLFLVQDRTAYPRILAFLAGDGDAGS